MRLLTLAAAVVLAALIASPAHADDEGSSQSATLAGESSDTLGVTVDFDRKANVWSMTVREKPGATPKTTKLPLPTEHAHFVVYVTPGRSSIVFVESYVGLTNTRSKVDLKDKLAWVFTPQGKLVRTWTYGQVFKQKEVDAFQRSVSHLSWNEKTEATKAGLALTVEGGKRTITIDKSARTMK
jgi:hypothetical protein